MCLKAWKTFGTWKPTKNKIHRLQTRQRSMQQGPKRQGKHHNNRFGTNNFKKYGHDRKKLKKTNIHISIFIHIYIYIYILYIYIIVLGSLGGRLPAKTLWELFFCFFQKFLNFSTIPPGIFGSCIYSNPSETWIFQKGKSIRARDLMNYN